MRAFHILKISIPLPGLAEPEEGWHPAFTQDLAAKGAYHGITREGLLVLIPVGGAGVARPAEDAPAAVAYTGELRFDAGGPGGGGGKFAARLDEGRVRWAERLDYERFQGRARLYYREGRPIAMTDGEYRERRRADHGEALTEDHVVETVAPRAASDGGEIGVETRTGARFAVVPEDDLPLPEPGDGVRLYLVPGPSNATPGEVGGVDLNGVSVYYEVPEEHARRSRRAHVGGDFSLSRAIQAWSELGSRRAYTSSAYGSTASGGTIFLPPEVRREAERRNGRMEEAKLRVQEETLRLMGHALNFSYAAADRATPDILGPPWHPGPQPSTREERDDYQGLWGSD